MLDDTIVVDGYLKLIWQILHTVSPPRNGQCIIRSCNQIISGRSLRYGRALAIILGEEYLDAVRVVIIRCIV